MTLFYTLESDGKGYERVTKGKLKNDNAQLMGSNGPINIPDEWGVYNQKLIKTKTGFLTFTWI